MLSNGTLWRMVGVAGVLLLLAACSREAPRHTSDWSVAYHDLETDRIAVCDVNGGGTHMLTPDSLRASLPAGDTTGQYLLFVGAPRRSEVGPYGIYRIERDGTGLRQLMLIPFRPISLTVSVSGKYIVFGGKYADEEYPRLYGFQPGESGFRALVPGDRPALDPTFSRSETNFMFDKNPPSDTGWAGFATGDRPMPIRSYPLRQGTFHPSGESIAGLCDTTGTALCVLWFRTFRDSVIVQPEEPGTVLANPQYCPDGMLICYEFTTPGETDGPRLGIYDANASNNNELHTIAEHARWPAWIR